MGCGASQTAKPAKKPQFEQVGGHEGGIVFNGNKITKKTKAPEAVVYEQMFKQA